MIKHLNKETLSTILRGPLPGEAAQMKLAPGNREGERERSTFTEAMEDKRECRTAAVLLLLYPDGDHIHTVFIKRNEYDGPHSGQISFPGGMYEEEDLDLQQTALRETEEEIGIGHKKIEVLGKLTPLYIPISNFCVSPYVGWISECPKFNPDSNEVQYLLTPTLNELMDNANHRGEVLHHNGLDIKAPCILIDEDILWGATAMILSEFMELIDR